MSDPRKQHGKTFDLTVSERQLATILAALHHWRLDLASNGCSAADFPEYFREKDPLSCVEVMELSDSLNFD